MWTFAPPLIKNIGQNKMLIYKLFEILFMCMKFLYSVKSTSTRKSASLCAAMYYNYDLKQR